MKHDGGLVMIWRCMTAFGPGALYKIEGRMDKHVYKFNLYSFLWSSATQNYNLDPSRLIFQEDNDPKHTSKIVREWFNSRLFQLLRWHAQSLDFESH